MQHGEISIQDPHPAPVLTSLYRTEELKLWGYPIDLVPKSLPEEIKGTAMLRFMSTLLS